MTKLKSKRLEFTEKEIQRFKKLAKKEHSTFKQYAEYVIISMGNGDSKLTKTV